MASLTADLLAPKSLAHFASFGSIEPGGYSPETMLRPIVSAMEECTLPRLRIRVAEWTSSPLNRDVCALAVGRLMGSDCLFVTCDSKLKISDSGFAVCPKSVKCHGKDDNAPENSTAKNCRFPTMSSPCAKLRLGCGPLEPGLQPHGGTSCERHIC